MKKPGDKHPGSEPPRNQSRRSIFGILSVSVLVIGFLLAIGVLFLSPPDTDSSHFGMRDIGRFAMILVFTFVIGTVASLIALARREKNRILIFIGLLLNGGPLVWGIFKNLFR